MQLDASFLTRVILDRLHQTLTKSRTLAIQEWGLSPQVADFLATNLTPEAIARVSASSNRLPVRLSYGGSVDFWSTMISASSSSEVGSLDLHQLQVLLQPPEVDQSAWSAA